MSSSLKKTSEVDQSKTTSLLQSLLFAERALTPVEQALHNRDKDVLLDLLSRYSDEWKHHSNQIWSTGSIFIPLSLSGVAFISNDLLRNIAIALFSIILIWIWYIISSTFRNLLDRAWRVYAALESALLHLDPPYLSYGISEVIPRKKSISSRNIRLIIALVITMSWILILVVPYFFRNHSP